MLKPDVVIKFAPELDAALRYLLWHVSVCTNVCKILAEIYCVKYTVAYSLYYLLMRFWCVDFNFILNISVT